MKLLNRKTLISFLNTILKSIGILSLLMLILAFTDLPYFAYHQLSLSKKKLNIPAKAIVIMGADGMPSPEGLIRAYYGSKAATENPNAKVFIALPKNQGVDSLLQLQLMASELISKNISSQRIVFASKGINTRTQAIEIAQLIDSHEPILIVSSPEHLYRAIKSFEKVGFEQIGSYPTFENPPEEEELKRKTGEDDETLKNLALRYNVWSYLQYEIKVLREYTAITYYWLMGWI